MIKSEWTANKRDDEYRDGEEREDGEPLPQNERREEEGEAEEQEDIEELVLHDVLGEHSVLTALHEKRHVYAVWALVVICEHPRADGNAALLTSMVLCANIATIMVGSRLEEKGREEEEEEEEEGCVYVCSMCGQITTGRELETQWEEEWKNKELEPGVKAGVLGADREQ